jgi:hypothetical protein
MLSNAVLAESIIKTENLYEFDDGKTGYSGQGTA